MSLSDYMSDYRTELSEYLDVPVIEGPLELAINSQSERTFVCLSETTATLEPFNTELSYDLPLMVDVEIYVEKNPLSDLQHIERARQILWDTWLTLGKIKPSGFDISREGFERIPDDSVSHIAYNIRTTLKLVEYESCP